MLSKKQIRIIAGLIALLLVGVMVLSIVADGIVFAQAASSSSLKSQLAKLERQRKAVKAEIVALDKKVDVYSEKKAKIDEQMGITEDEIDTTKSLVKELSGEIDQTTVRLGKAEEALDQKSELFKTRIRVMYESGEITYLDVLLDSENLTDMLSRIEIMSQIMDYDKKVVAEYTAAKQEIADTKVELETQKQEQQQYQSSLEQKYDELAAQTKEQQSIINQLNGDLALKKKEAEKMEAQKKELNSEIERLSKLEAANGAKVPTSGMFTWPLPGYGKGAISSPYGYRIHPITGKRTMHSGTDLRAPKGTKIVAAAAGTVIKSYMSSSYGNYIVINHGGGIMTAYAHLSKRSLSVGDKVTAGQKVGEVGSTGNSTGNHLHFEIYVNGSTVDPMKYFK